MAAALSMPLSPDPALAAITAVRSELRAYYLERDDLIDVTLTALVGQLDALALGGAGVAKTSIIQAVLSHITGATLFETQLHRLMMPDGLFGPISVKGLEEDSYRYVTRGRLPEAHVAFLSEMSEGSAHILNSLRVLLSQREFEQDGTFAPVPLISCFFDSNRLPGDDEGLAPLVDRLVLRVVVPDITDGAFVSFLRGALAAPAYTPVARLPLDALYRLHALRRDVLIPHAVLEHIGSLRTEARTAGIEASPRRWKQALRALQATALLDGRLEVADDDLAVFGHILWNTPEERQHILGMTARRANPLVAEAVALGDHIASIAAEGVAAARANVGLTDRAQVAANEQTVGKASLEIRTARTKLQGLLERAEREGRGLEKITAQVERAKALHKTYVRDTGLVM